MKPKDSWDSTSFEGVQRDKLEDYLKLTEFERFKLLCELYELFKDSLPPRTPHPFGGVVYSADKPTSKLEKE